MARSKSADSESVRQMVSRMEIGEALVFPMDRRAYIRFLSSDLSVALQRTFRTSTDTRTRTVTITRAL